MAERTNVKYSTAWQWAKRVFVKYLSAWEDSIPYVRTSGVWKPAFPQSYIPQGAILLFVGTVVPTGFTRYSAADGRLIVGAGGAYNVAATQGSDSHTYAANTNNTGGHTGSGGFNILANSSSPGNRYRASGTAGAHEHAYSEAITTLDVYKEFMLIKADGPTFKIPADALVLSDSAGLDTSTGLSLQETTIDKFVRGAATYGGTGGDATPAKTFTSTNIGAHRHGVGWSYSAPYNATISSIAHTNRTDGGHTHQLTINVTLATKQKYLAAYGNTSIDVFSVPNAIMMFDGGTIPDGFVVCDGTNGTPDMRDFHLRIKALADAGNSSGNNSAPWSLSSDTSPVHEHNTEYTGGYPNADSSDLETAYHASNFAGHTHSSSGSSTVTQNSIALHFIRWAA